MLKTFGAAEDEPVRPTHHTDFYRALVTYKGMTGASILPAIDGDLLVKLDRWIARQSTPITRADAIQRALLEWLVKEDGISKT